MTEIESELLQALMELEAAVAVRTEPRPGLMPHFERIDALAARLGPAADTELRHFLQRKSYEKARLRLQGLEAERGRCGH